MHHRFFCDQISLLNDDADELENQILGEILARCEVYDEVPILKDEEWASINRIFNYFVQELYAKKHPEAKVRSVDLTEEEKILSQFLK